MNRGLTAGLSLAVCLAAVFSVPGFGWAQTEPLVVAVAPFEDLNPTSDFAFVSRGTAEALATKLASCKRFRLVERSQIQQVAKELRLQASGFVDPTTACQAGKWLGAQAVVAGSYTFFQDMLRFDCRVVNVETAEVMGSVEVSGGASDLFALYSELAIKLVSAMSAAPVTPTETNNVSAYGTASINAFKLYVAANDKLYGSPDAPAVSKYVAPSELLAAESLLRQALEMDPSFVQAWDALGITEQKLKNFAAARQAYEKAMSLDAGYPNSFSNLATLLIDQSDYKGAAPLVETSLRINPDFAAAVNSKAYLLFYSGKTEDALKTFVRAKKLAPGMSDAYVGIAACASRMGDQGTAIEYYMKALERDHDNLVALEILADFYFNCGQDDTAKKYIERAIEYETDEAKLNRLKKMLASL